MLTTHSPALLNALDGDDHPGAQLHHLPGYLRTMAQSRLGHAVTQGLLTGTEPSRGPGKPTAADLDALLGIG